MAFYDKPVITNGATGGLIPIAALSPVPVFISPVAPLAAVAAAIFASRKGNSVIDSTHTSALTARKNFELA